MTTAVSGETPNSNKVFVVLGEKRIAYFNHLPVEISATQLSELDMHLEVTFLNTHDYMQMLSIQKVSAESMECSNSFLFDAERQGENPLANQKRQEWLKNANLVKAWCKLPDAEMILAAQRAAYMQAIAQRMTATHHQSAADQANALVPFIGKPGHILMDELETRRVVSPDCCGTVLPQFASYFRDWIVEDDEYNADIKGLHISNCKLTELVSDTVYHFTNLTFLDLSNNYLTTLPVEIGRLSQLKELVLNNNRIAHFPETVVNLRRVKKIQLLSNQCVVFPLNLERYPALEVLWLQGDFEYIPERLFQMTTLTELVVRPKASESGIDLSDDLSKLTQLKTLDITHVTSIPETIGRLENIEKISLTNGKIQELPKNLSRLPHLVKLSLACNKIEAEPSWIAAMRSQVAIDLRSQST